MNSHVQALFEHTRARGGKAAYFPTSNTGQLTLAARLIGDSDTLACASCYFLKLARRANRSAGGDGGEVAGHAAFVDAEFSQFGMW